MRAAMVAGQAKVRYSRTTSFSTLFPEDQCCKNKPKGAVWKYEYVQKPASQPATLQEERSAERIPTERGEGEGEQEERERERESWPRPWS